jgi:hypothetical protein
MEAQQIIESYKRGDKVVLIESEFKISSASIYKILHDANVPLRENDPNHPASSLATRRAAGVMPKLKIEDKSMNETNQRLERIEEKLKLLDSAVGSLVSIGYMDIELKIDIVLAFLQSKQVSRELAKKILEVVEAINNI